jgi:molybdopterin-containing oxidoreductase family iron-sulfur binding subunit
MDKVLQRITNEVKRDFNVDAQVRDLKPMDGVEFVYCLNLTRCIGCRKCVHACVAENNQSRTPEIQYIRVLRLPHGSLDIEKAEHFYDPESVPEKGYFYMPVQCQQCKNPPCVKVCPVKATWQEYDPVTKKGDGITVIDYDWCIGCRYCEAACPYWARRFNFTKPGIPKDRVNPNMAYLGNRPRKQGVMEKCHFCIQRTRAGRYPACLEVCPTGARKFGNALDPNSEVAYILKTKRVFIQLKEELGTSPRFFYYFDV